MQTHLYLSLHTDPIHLRGLATGVAAELIPAIFQHPADFALGPHRKSAGISSGNHTTNIHPRRRSHHTVGADHRKQSDHAVFCQLLALLQHPGINNAVAGSIQQFDAGLDGVAFTDRIGSEFHHITVVDDEHVVAWYPHRLGGFAVGHEHAVLAMHGHKILGLG